MTTWKPMVFEGCAYCGEPCEILTTSTSTEGMYYDGDSVHCTACGATGQWVVDEAWDSDDEPGEAYVLWDDEPIVANATERGE